jgi:2-keto-3-deoxy-L-fuconate dehydrogenase
MDCDSDEFYRSVNVNIYSAYLMSQNLLPKMLKNKKGNIIIVSSAASNVKGVPNRFIYGTTKAALNGFVKAIAADYVRKVYAVTLFCLEQLKLLHGKEELNG